MKNTVLLTIASCWLGAGAYAGTALTFGTANYGSNGPCWQASDFYYGAYPISANFTLPTTSGTGTVSSSVFWALNSLPSGSHLVYEYTLDLTQIPAAASHCLKLLIHFGTPVTCEYDVLVSPGAGANLLSAIKAPYGDINFSFNSGCLNTGTHIKLAMLSNQQAKTNIVTIIDDYTDPASGITNEVKINVPALVPAVPPNWAYAPPSIPNIFFQGILYTNPVPLGTNGLFDVRLQLVDALTNGLPISPAYTQSVNVINGVFNTALPFDPSSYGSGGNSMIIAVRPSGSGGFTQLEPALTLSPTPQALFAYAAGTVSDLAPGQAVTSIDGLTDGVTLEAGTGIAFSTNGNTLVISLAGPGGPLVVGNGKTGNVSSAQQGLERKIQRQAAQLEEASRELQNLKARIGELSRAVQNLSSPPASDGE
jgi:hypothetical protein